MSLAALIRIAHAPPSGGARERMIAGTRDSLGTHQADPAPARRAGREGPGNGLGLERDVVAGRADRRRTALGEVGGAVFALRAPDRDVEVVGLVDPFAALILAAAVDRHPHLADGRPALQAP